MADTPNMDLPLPDVSTTPGPDWAQSLNDSLELVDTHDHSTGKGVKVTPAGLNINAALPLNANDLSEANSVLFENRTTDISVTRGVYVKNGDLFYYNNAGQVVQLTNGSSIAGTNGSFTGLSSPAAATYSSINKQFVWTFDSGKLARMANADIQLYPYDASTAYTKAITFKAPTGLEATASYSVTWPTALPAAVQLLNIDNAGLVDHASLSGTTNQVNVSFNAGAVVLSTPQDTATTSSPQFLSATLLQTGNVVDVLTVRKSSTTPYTNNYDGLLALRSTDATGGDAVGIQYRSNQIYWFAGITKASTTYDFWRDLTGTPTKVFGIAANGALSSDGAVGAPAYSFLNDTDNGMYRSAADTVAFSAGGTLRQSISTTAITSTIPMLNADGSAGAPAFSFSGDTDTGIFRSATDRIGFAAGAGNRMSIGTADVTFGVAILADAGTSSTPGIAFNGDGDTGIYRVGTNKMGFVAGGTERVSISTTEIGSGLVYQGPVGTSDIPALSFSADTDTGFYRFGANEIGVTCGTSLSAVFSGAGIRSAAIISTGDGSVSAPTHTFTNDLNTGMWLSAADSLAFATGGSNAFVIGSNQQLQGVIAGSASAPTFTFASDLNTGIYNSATDTLAIAAGGSSIATFASSGATIPTLSGTTITSTGTFKAADGSAAAPTITFTSDTDTGIFNLSANTIGFASSGVAVGYAFTGGTNAGRYIGAYNPDTGRTGLLIDKAWGDAQKWSIHLSNDSTGPNLRFSPGYDIAGTSDVLQLSPTGEIFAPNLGTITSVSANVRYTPASGEFSEITSSIRYKTNVNTIESAASVYDLRPVTYTSLCKGEDPDLIGLGLIAEEVAEIDPRLTYLDEENLPRGVNYDRLPILMLVEMKKLKQRLDAAGL